MKKKLERYLAEKQGIDDFEISPSEDGRYDFMGDFEGVLHAVRAKDRPSSVRGSSSARKNEARHHHHMAHPHIAYYHQGYAVPLYDPWSKQWGEHHATPYVATPHVHMPPPEYTGVFSSTRKSMFDSSPGGFDRHVHHSYSPDGGSLKGHSPSNHRLAFTTPLPSESIPNFSPDEADSLNKTLFMEGLTTPFAVSNTFSADPLRFSIGSDAGIGHRVNGMSIGNRVSISPICKEEKTSFWTAKDQAIMPPPTAPRVRDAPRVSSSAIKVGSELAIYQLPVTSNSKTPCNVTQEGSPADMDDGGFASGQKVVKGVATPSTAITEQSSFWSDGLGISPGPLSPFQSPNVKVRLRSYDDNIFSPQAFKRPKMDGS